VLSGTTYYTNTITLNTEIQRITSRGLMRGTVLLDSPRVWGQIDEFSLRDGYFYTVVTSY